MKILIQNYSSALTTEPFYFMECLKRVGIDAHLWANNNVSAFDIFDTIQPDIVKYLSQNKNIKPVINVTGTDAQQLEGITQTFISMGMQDYTLFTNNFKHPHGDAVHTILPCFDVFVQATQPQFNIPLAIVTDDKNERVDGFIKDKDVYHVVSYGKKEEWSDYSTDIRSFWGVSKCYDEVTLIDDGLISTSQFFFQASMLCNKFNVTSQSQEQREAFQEVLSLLFTSEETEEGVESVIKKQIIKNHTCFNRASQLCGILGMKDKSDQLLEMIK